MSVEGRVFATEGLLPDCLFSASGIAGKLDSQKWPKNIFCFPPHFSEKNYRRNINFPRRHSRYFLHRVHGTLIGRVESSFCRGKKQFFGVGRGASCAQKPVINAVITLISRVITPVTPFFSAWGPCLTPFITIGSGPTFWIFPIIYGWNFRRQKSLLMGHSAWIWKKGKFLADSIPWDSSPKRTKHNLGGMIFLFKHQKISKSKCLAILRSWPFWDGENVTLLNGESWPPTIGDEKVTAWITWWMILLNPTPLTLGV